MVCDLVTQDWKELKIKREEKQKAKEKSKLRKRTKKTLTSHNEILLLDHMMEYTYLMLHNI